MLEVVAVVAVVVFALLAGFAVALLLELRATAQRLRSFMDRAEAQLLPTLKELQEALKRLREIQEQAGGVVDDVRQVSASLRGAAEGLKGLVELTDEVATKARASAVGIKAGLKTALEVLVKNLLRKGG
jgi:uncharacterized protein YoxC